MRLLAPAKLNLHLRVAPARPDGFHPLLSWMCTAGLFDTLVLESIDAPSAASQAALVGSTEADEGPRIALQCDRPDLPTDHRNLVVRVAHAWGREARGIAGSQVGDVRVMLNKRIPAGAGLGGGSADGARMLQGINAIWKTGASAGRLAEFSPKFGSDLPFFFFGPSSVCKGRGEIVTPIAPPRPRWAVLILPELSMPTPAVYRKFDEMKLGRAADVEQEPDWREWSQLCSDDLLPRLANDLEAPAFAISPELGGLRIAIERSIQRIVRMSGSGSSLFTLFDAEHQANEVAAHIAQRHGTRAMAAQLVPDLMDDLG
jgi:4-diphosphocytidyl-2-C-methyl-D-erythritol kinase